MQVEINREAKPNSERSWPQLGVGVDWAGFLICATLDQKGLALGLDEAPSPEGVRLSALPRSAFELKMGRRQLSWKTSPTLEILWGLKKKPLSLENFWTQTQSQLNEIPSPLQAMQRLRRSDL